MHLQPLFQNAPTIGGNAAASAFDRGLCLPSGSAMGETDIDRVCGILRGLVG
jgi:pyridoxal phosphate-dependent aminotransferase EpsN